METEREREREREREASERGVSRQPRQIRGVQVLGGERGGSPEVQGVGDCVMVGPE